MIAKANEQQMTNRDILDLTGKGMGQVKQRQHLDTPFPAPVRTLRVVECRDRNGKRYIAVFAAKTPR